MGEEEIEITRVELKAGLVLTVVLPPGDPSALQYRLAIATFTRDDRRPHKLVYDRRAARTVMITAEDVVALAAIANSQGVEGDRTE